MLRNHIAAYEEEEEEGLNKILPANTDDLTKSQQAERQSLSLDFQSLKPKGTSLTFLDKLDLRYTFPRMH